MAIKKRIQQWLIHPADWDAPLPSDLQGYHLDVLRLMATYEQIQQVLHGETAWTSEWNFEQFILSFWRVANTDKSLKRQLRRVHTSPPVLLETPCSSIHEGVFDACVHPRMELERMVDPNGETRGGGQIAYLKALADRLHRAIPELTPHRPDPVIDGSRVVFPPPTVKWTNPRLHGDDVIPQLQWKFTLGSEDSTGGELGESAGQADPPVGGRLDPKAETHQMPVLLRLASVYTNQASDDRFKQAMELISDDKLSANEKLSKVDKLVPFPPTASAMRLGKLLGVTKQAVMKTQWWNKNRKGEKENEVGRRHAKQRERSSGHERSRLSDDGD